MKRSALFAVVVAILVLAVAGGGYWWSHRASYAYQGMAGRFPSSVDAFVEVKELGQWIPFCRDDTSGKKEGSGEVVSDAPSQGGDPMLLVLKTVWAAPPITAKDLPDILRTKAMAAGVWLEGKTLKGAAYMPLAPGERAAVEKALKDKMGDGAIAGTIEGVQFRTITVPCDESDFKFAQPVWGIGDQCVVIALGMDGAKASLVRPDKPLSKDATFLSALKMLPGEPGATLFVRGAMLKKGMEEHGITAKASSPVPPATEPPAKAAPEGPPSKIAIPGLAAGPDQAPPGSAVAKGDREESSHSSEVVDALVKAGAAKFLAIDSVDVFALWTAPPGQGEKGWRVSSWIGLNQDPKGIWRLAAQGTAKAPQIVGRLPRKGQIYVWGAGRDPARLYQDIMDELGRDLPADKVGSVRAVIGAAEGKLGLSFANELLPALADEWCVVSERVSKGEAGDSDAKSSHRSAFFIALRDSRRFEDLVSQKIVPQFKCKALDLQGARGWALTPSGSPEDLSLVVTGGIGILTNAPSWALDTGGSPEKAYKALSEAKGKACIQVYADPAAWDKGADVLTAVQCVCSPKGLSLSGRFPGQVPGRK